MESPVAGSVILAGVLLKLGDMVLFGFCGLYFPMPPNTFVY